MSTKHDSAASLPIKHDLRLVYLVTFIVALIMTIASVYGIIFPSAIYPTEKLLRTFMPNDVVNLIIGVPILLGSMWLTRRGKLIGLLL